MFISTLDYAPSVEEIDARYGADLNVFGATPWNMRTLPRGRVKSEGTMEQMRKYYVSSYMSYYNLEPEFYEGAEDLYKEEVERLINVANDDFDTLKKRFKGHKQDFIDEIIAEDLAQVEARAQGYYEGFVPDEEKAPEQLEGEKPVRTHEPVEDKNPLNRKDFLEGLTTGAISVGAQKIVLFDKNTNTIHQFKNIQELSKDRKFRDYFTDLAGGKKRNQNEPYGDLVVQKKISNLMKESAVLDMKGYNIYDYNTTKHPDPKKAEILIIPHKKRFDSIDAISGAKKTIDSDSDTLIKPWSQRKKKSAGANKIVKT